MNEELLRKFCEFRHRWLIVIAGTFVVGLLLILPIVDVYYAGLDEKSELETELVSARTTAAEIEVYERNLTEKQAQLALLEARTVDEQRLPALRGRLLELAKETGCSIRRLNVGAAVNRPWKVNDDPLSTKADVKASEDDKRTAFQLEWRPVLLSLSGASGDLRNLLERIAGMGMIMHTKSLELFPSSLERQTLTLDLELWFFTLVRRG